MKTGDIVELINATILHCLMGEKPHGWGPDIGFHVLDALEKRGLITKPREWITCFSCGVTAGPLPLSIKESICIQHLSTCATKESVHVVEAAS